MEPESASRTFFDSRSLSCDGDVLTWESSAEDIDPFEFGEIDFGDVSVAGDGRPVFLKDGLTEGFPLDEPSGFKPACSFETEVDSADSRKEGADCEFPVNAYAPHFSQPPTVLCTLSGKVRQENANPY